MTGLLRMVALAGGLAVNDQMEFRVLGPLEILADGRPVKVDAPKQRAILAMLLIHANEVVSTDELMEAIWAEEQPAGGPRTLRYHIFKLREALPADVIKTRTPGYVLEVSPSRVDTLLFQSLLTEARDTRATDRSGALKRLDEALGLWRGSAYADFTYDEFAHTEILSLHELQLRAMEDRFDICIELGREDEVISELQRLVDEYPRRERLTGSLMLALYRMGRQAEALSVYQELRRELGEGLGIEPSQELQDLEERILLQDTSLDETAAAPAAQFLRGYVLRGLIGEGAHGLVWRAGQPGVGREVAIKAIHPDISNQPGFVRRFEMEAQLVASLEHPHIVSLFDFWRDPDGAYLVMPYLRGGDLDHLLRQGPLLPDTVLELIRAIGGALAYAHRRGVIHRDVTPHNVLLDEEGHPYLADFGVATLIGETGPPISSSPAYLSPEQHAGRGAAPQSDVYSLGVLTHAVLTGQAPVEGEQLHPVSSYRPDLAPTLDEIIEVATAIDVTERYDSPDALVADLSRSLGAAAPVAVAPVIETRNPYKGLRAFAETDAGDFFGRESLETELVQAVSRHRLVGVIGPSGCGKSSLVRAGLVPLLRRGVLPGSDRWLITDMYPGSQPFAELQAALLRVAVDLPERFGERLAGDAAGRKALLGELLPPDTELLLIIDQFEELFTLTPDEDTRTRFLAALVEFAGDPLNRIRLVVTLRADFYDRPLEYPEFAELLRKGQVTVAVPGQEGLLKAVTGPAQRVSLEVEAGLAERITNDVSGQPGGLPLLEYALTELFQRRTESRLTVAGYEQTGGVLGALGRRAEDLYAGRDETGQQAVQQVFLRLVTVEEGSADTRRRIPLTELRGMGLDPDALQQVLDDYGSHRLLTFDRDPDTRAPTVEVAHEALLTRWDRLRTWIDDRRDDLVLHRRLAASLSEWTDSGERPEYLLGGGRLEHYETFAAESDIVLTEYELEFIAASRTEADRLRGRRQRRRRAILAGFAVAAFIASLLAVLAHVNQRNAERTATRSRALELSRASVGVLDEDPELAILLAIEAAEIDVDGGAVPEAVSGLHQALLASRVMYRLPGTPVMSADSNGRYLLGPIGEGEPVVVRDLGSGEIITTLPGTEDARSVAMSSDGALVATGSADGVVTVWNPATGAALWDGASHDEEVYQLAFSPDGSILASRSRDRTLRLWDVATQRPVSTITDLGRDFSTGGGLVFNSDATLIAATDLSQVGVWDVRSGSLLHSRSGRMGSVAFLPDNRLLVSYFAGDVAIGVWDPGSATEQLTGRSGGELVRRLEVNEAGDRIVGGSDTGRLTLWDLRSNSVTLDYVAAGHNVEIGSIQFVGPDRAVSSSFDGTVLVWDTSPAGRGEGVALPGENAGFGAVAYSPSGNQVASGPSDDFWIRDSRTGEPLTRLDPLLVLPPNYNPQDLPLLAFIRAEFTRDGSMIATSFFDYGEGQHGTVALWDTSDGSVVHSFDSATAPLGSSLDLDVNLDSTLLAATNGGEARVWSLDTYEEMLFIAPEDGDVVGIALDPSGSRLAVEIRRVDVPRHTVHVEVFDLEGNQLISTGQHDVFYADGLEFSPDGEYMVTTGLDEAGSGLAVVWDAASGDRVGVMRGSGSEIFQAVFSPDGSRIATGEDGMVRLWDAESFELIVAFPGHRGFVNDLAFSPDGTRLITLADLDGLVRTWLLDIEELVGLARDHVTRIFTTAECEIYDIDPCPAND